MRRKPHTTEPLDCRVMIQWYSMPDRTEQRPREYVVQIVLIRSRTKVIIKEHTFKTRKRMLDHAQWLEGVLTTATQDHAVIVHA